MNGQFEIGAVTPARYFFGIAAVLGLLLGFTSGEGEAPGLGMRLLQWQLQSLGIMACLVLAQVALHYSRWFERRDPWVQLALSGVAGALAFAPAGVLIDQVLGGEQVAPGMWLREVLDEFSGIAPPAIICWLAINAPWVLGFRVERLEQVSAETEAGEVPLNHIAPAPQPPFFELLAQDLRGPVVYLQAELHYISVVTSRGRSLILYNLRDAIEELTAIGVSGLQCHRSFWVAKDAVEELRRVGRQGELRLTNGETVPVSRRNLDAVRAGLAS